MNCNGYEYINVYYQYSVVIISILINIVYDNFYFWTEIINFCVKLKYWFHNIYYNMNNQIKIIIISYYQNKLLK